MQSRSSAQGAALPSCDAGIEVSRLTTIVLKRGAMDYATQGMVFFLFGLFCAYWAQEAKRNAWLWFFLGLFFAPLTGIVLVYKNSEDRRAKAPG